MKKIFVYILGILLLCTACETVIEFKGDFIAPMLVLNSTIQPNSNLKVKLTRSRFFLSQDDFTTPAGSKVELWVNGVYKELLTQVNDSFVSINYRVQIGDSIQVRASAPTFTNVISDIVVIKQPALVEMSEPKFVSVEEPFIYYSRYNEEEESWDPMIMKQNTKLVTYIDITDPELNKRNYFRLKVSGVEVVVEDNDTVRSPIYARIEYDDVVFGNSVSNDFEIIEQSRNSYGLFSDELFANKTYRIKVEIDNVSFYEIIPPSSYSDLYNEVTIILEHVDYPYYMYYKTLDVANSGGVIMTEPVQIYSNIQNGIGIICTSVPTAKTIKVSQQY